MSKARKRSWITKALRKAYEHHMASLPEDGKYDLLEELTSGTIINHLREASLDELKSYVRAVFIDSAPPAFIIRPSYSQPTTLPKKMRRLFNA